MELTLRQRRFCEECAAGREPGEAAARAGYSAKTAARQARRLLKNPAVLGALKKAGEGGDIVADLLALKEICFGRRPIKTTEIDKSTGEAVIRESIIFEPRVAKSALELLGRITGTFSESEVDRQLEVNIKVVE